MFVDGETFRSGVAAGLFLEWANFLGDLYGTPMPEPPPGHDLVLEIDVQGAAQVLAGRPDAVVILVVAPSRQVQEDRLRARGESEEVVVRRVRRGQLEVEEAEGLADHVVVNDDLERAVSELVGIVESYRSGRATAVPGA